MVIAKTQLVIIDSIERKENGTISDTGLFISLII